MDKDLIDDERVDTLAEIYSQHAGIPKALACNAVIGGLYRLWRHGDTHLGRHNRLKGALRGPARIAEVTALPLSLIERFPKEWLAIHEDGSIELPDYSAKNSLIDRDLRRERGRERVRKWRERQKQKDRESNASQSVTDEALHRYKSVTTGTGTETGTSETGTGPVTERAALGVTPSAPAPRKSLDEELQTRFGVGPRSAAELLHRQNGKQHPEPPSSSDLESKALKLSAGGLPAADIVASLRTYGVTHEQVTAWLANAPSAPAPAQ